MADPGSADQEILAQLAPLLCVKQREGNSAEIITSEIMGGKDFLKVNCIYWHHSIEPMCYQVCIG